MKKVFLLALIAIATLTVTSCKKTENVNETKIIDSTSVSVDSVQVDSTQVDTITK